MPYKLYNPEPIGFKARLQNVQGEVITDISIPARGYVCTKSIHGIAENYPFLEITAVSDEVYEQYIKDTVKLEKEYEKAEKERKERQAEEVRREAKLTETKIKAREKEKEEERKKKLEVKLGMIKQEEEELKKVEETIVTVYPQKVADTKKRGRKAKNKSLNA